MDKTKLLAPRVELNTGVVDIEGVGAITVRGLSRLELALSSKRFPGEDQNLERERWILSTAVVDPSLTEADVELWQANSIPGEINEVAAVINRLSGIGKDAQKSSVSGV